MSNGKVARLEILGLEAPLKDKEYFHDDGFVEEIVKHAEKVNLMYGHSSDYRIVDLQKWLDSVGFYISREFNGEVHHHICYKHSKYRFLESVHKAHEETHFLNGSGNFDILVNALINEGIDTKKLHKFSVESKAYVGEIFALRKRRIGNLVEWLTYLTSGDREFREARALFFNIKRIITLFLGR